MLVLSAPPPKPLMIKPAREMRRHKGPWLSLPMTCAFASAVHFT